MQKAATGGSRMMYIEGIVVDDFLTMAPNKVDLPPLEELNRLLRYDPVTGLLYWKHRLYHPTLPGGDLDRWNRKYAGQVAGSKRKGQIMIKLGATQFVAHRVAWVLAGRYLPPKHMHLDHINGNPWDNRLSNLRVVSPSQNAKNRQIKMRSVSGVRGAHWHSRDQKWTASIRLEGRRILHLGEFPTKGMAALAYAKAAMRYFGEYSRFSALANEKFIKAA